jgi:hypothetical protein
VDQAGLQGTGPISWRLEFQKADLLGIVLEWAVFDGHFDYTSASSNSNRCRLGWNSVGVSTLVIRKMVV